MAGVKAAVIAGQPLNLGIDNTKLRLGDFNIEEEQRLKKEGRWSIGRSFATKEERQKITEHVDQLLAAK